jgi:hypothetical protein
MHITAEELLGVVVSNQSAIKLYTKNWQANQEALLSEPDA